MMRETHTTAATVTTADVEQWLSGRAWSPNTRRMAVLGLRQFFEWLQQSGRRADNPCAGLHVPRVPPVAVQTCTQSELRDAMNRPHDRIYWALRIGACTGLRRSELACLHRDQLRDGWLTIPGKGGRVRRIPVPPDVERHILRSPGWVFPSCSGRHVAPIYLATLMRKETGISPHMLRRYYATRVYQSGHDVHAVQHLLGHSSIDTTERYLGLDDTELMTAARTAWAA